MENDLTTLRAIVKTTIPEHARMGDRNAADVALELLDALEQELEALAAEAHLNWARAEHLEAQGLSVMRRVEVIGALVDAIKRGEP